MSRNRETGDDSATEAFLAAWSQGNAEAFEKLVPLVYERLHTRAQTLVRRESDSYAPEELVHDLYVSLRALRSPHFTTIAAFHAFSMRVMRNLLIDRARKRLAAKRGGGAQRIRLSELGAELVASEEFGVDTRLMLESLWEGLGAKSPTTRQVAVLRLEAGYTTSEIAEILEVRRSVVARHWEIAKRHIRETMDTTIPLVVEHAAPPRPPTEIIRPVVDLDLVSPELIQALTLHPELMKTLDWRAFEHLLATILEKLEYEVELQRGTQDGGIDIFAIKRGGPLGPHRYLLQAKRWTAAVDVQPVRELLFLRDQHRVTKACLATTSRFTRGAWRLGDEYKWVLELRDYLGLQEWVRLCNKG